MGKRNVLSFLEAFGEHNTATVDRGEQTHWYYHQHSQGLFQLSTNILKKKHTGTSEMDRGHR
jgi:hypothetical protein